MPVNKPSYNEKKATAVATKLLQLAGERKKHKWVIKMLYLIERESLARYERPVIYDNLCSMENGQVVSITYNIIKGEAKGDYWQEHIKKNWLWELYVDKSLLPSKQLSEAELEIVADVFDQFGHLGPDQLAQYTHSLPEYRDPGKSSLPTRYEDLLQHLGYSSGDSNRILEELRQEALLDNVLGY